MDTWEAAGFEQLVVFKLWGENYAVNIASVHEIIHMDYMTMVPRTPPFLKGVINLRGRIIPVFDLKKRFKKNKRTQVTKETRIIIVEAGAAIAGLIVDGISEVVRMPQSGIEPPPVLGDDFDRTMIRAVGRLGDELIMLLNIKKVIYEIGKNDIA